ncbi:hypothetical protein ACTQ5K_00100 [Niallia sp. Sow4_A1]|uniref:hypothetical protein n=1 Tax=unclassified Niallia TaxID=2837522 RepID=UPI002041595F|nr:hypothetical protein [Niallia sp. MER TA 168]MCM3361045.1 hypothetical protein [Niallia sp. MER TA 168]
MSFSLSPIGLVIAIGLLLPNILFIIFFPPKNIPSKTRSTPLIFPFMERVGQIGCLFLLSTTTNPVKVIDGWLILSLLFLLLYYLLWIMYVKNDRDYSFLTKSFLFIPIPLAILPCCIFFVSAIWGHSIWLGIGTIIFAIGHWKVSSDSIV